MSLPATVQLHNKGLLLQNGDVIQEEPEEEENGDWGEESEDDIELELSKIENSNLPSFNK